MDAGIGMMVERADSKRVLDSVSGRVLEKMVLKVFGMRGLGPIYSRSKLY